MNAIEEPQRATYVRVQRLGVVMEPDGSPNEAEGVCNAAAACGLNGALYLFPRLVGRGNYSRIGIARVRFDAAGNPAGVERLGIALEPEAPYERTETGGGCEDPRITYVTSLQTYVMTYTALGPRGPRVALAVSRDLFAWERIGLVWFTQPNQRIDFNGVFNKDAVVFAETIADPEGNEAIGLIRRPLFERSAPEDLARKPAPRRVDRDRESMWISYCSLEAARCRRHTLCHFTIHRRLASPGSRWERLKIGAGTPPIRTDLGYVTFYHGVSGPVHDQVSTMTYSAGLMILDARDPAKIYYRSSEPVLQPQSREELSGTVDRVVFPTGADQRTDLRLPHRIDVYYGMADQRIGVARVDLPECLTDGASAHGADGCV